MATALGFLSFLLVAVSFTVWFRGIRDVAVPENRTPFVLVWLTALALGIGALASGVGILGGVPAVFGVLASALFLLTVAISAQRVEGDTIAVGRTLPHFAAPDEHEQLFDSASLRGHPVLIKFFRAHW